MEETLNCVNVGVDSQTSVKTIAEIVVEEMDLTNVKFRYTGGNRGMEGGCPIFSIRFFEDKTVGMGRAAYFR